jgi:uncharacterized protein DUF6220
MIWVRRAHLVFAWAFVAGVVVQVFLAGLGVFESSSKFGTHAGWGFLLGLLTIPLAILGGIGAGRRQALYGAALFGMFALQSILITFRDSTPAVAALHPVNGFAILLVSIVMAREAWATRSQPVIPSPLPQTAQEAAS